MPHKDQSDRIIAFLENRREELLDFTCRLVSTSSMNPPGDERAVVALIQEQMEKLDMPGSQLVFKAPERPNLIYTQKGKTGKPRLLFNGHTDTKPVGPDDAPMWHTPPLVPTRENGRLYGLGASDMKAGVAAMIYAAAALRSLPEPVAGDLLLIFTSNEEAAGEFGANWLVKNYDLKADFGLVGEPSGINSDFDGLPVTSRSTVIFKIKVHGTQMHSSLSDQFHSVNASVKMAWVIWRLAQEFKPRSPDNPFFPKGPTINLGDLVSGGQAVGTLSGYAEFMSDIRIYPGMTSKGVEQDIQQFLDKLRQEDPDLNVELQMYSEDQSIEWKYLSGKEPFFGCLQDACEQVLGKRLPLVANPGYTDAYWFHSYAGIPTVPAFGPGLLPLCHRPDEWVTLDAIVQASQIYALAALNLLEP